MGKLGERTLFRLLLDKEQLDILAMEQLNSKFLPTADLRPIYDWAMNYYYIGGRKFPLTAEVLKAQEYPDNRGKSMYDVLAEYEIIVDEVREEEDPHMDFALEDLKASYVSKELNAWTREATVTVTAAIGRERQVVLAEEATKLIGISLDLESKTTRVDLRECGPDFMQNYYDRKNNKAIYLGMSFGLPEVDDLTFGIHDGEVAIVGAFAKVGKSFFVDRVALKEWEKGRIVSLFTLENSLEMTQQRIACLALKIHPGRLERGELLPKEEDTLWAWWDEVGASPVPFHILRPEKAERTAEQLVLKARLLGTQSLIIDQLTFVEHENSRMSKADQVGDSVRTLKDMVNSPKDKMSCLMAHQFSRERYKIALKEKHHEMFDFADSSGVERGADWIFAMFQSPEMRQMGEVLFQTLGGRRGPIKNWDMLWSPETGSMRIVDECDLP